MEILPMELETVGVHCAIIIKGIRISLKTGVLPSGISTQTNYEL